MPHLPDEIALAANQGGHKPRVDFEKGIIYDVTLMTKGGVRPAADAGVDPGAHVADDVTLAQLCEGIISLVPITLETLLEQVLHSTWDPEASAFERKNPFANKVEMVSNSRLDDASEDAWYGLALLSDSVVGMEIAFLESQEGPVLRQEVSFNTDDIRFAIRHCVAAHAIDWRAFVQNPGVQPG